MKKFFPIVIRRSTRIIFNKAVCLNLALVMLFNLTSPVFAAQAQNKQEEEKLFKELNQGLQAEYAKSNASPTQSALDLCLKNSNKSACDEYINTINKMFTETTEETAKGKEPKEETFTPMSKQVYFKDLEKNTEEEVKTYTQEIKQEYGKQKDIIEQKYKGVGISSPDYASYMFAKQSLDEWKKEREQSLSDWQDEILLNRHDYYQRYLDEFEKNLAEYKQDKENALNEYLKELAGEIMSVYQKAPEASKLKLVPAFVYLLSMDSDKVRLFTSAQRSEIYRFFNRVISPSNKTNPCAFHTRQRNSNELKEYNAWQEHLKRMEEQTRGTLSARDQVAAQTRGYEQSISNDLRAPITELANEDACQAAMSALTGLSYFKGWDMSHVSMFMMKNAMEPMASQVLLLGTKTLIETNRLDAFSALTLYMIDREAAYEDNDDLKLKEAIFYKGRFYKTPYIYSRYSEVDGGGDVWQDISRMLANEKTPNSKKVQHDILDHSVSFSVASDAIISFNHNLPFVYGLILNNPQIIDTFVPSNANAYYHGKYDYNGKVVYFQYDEEKADVYIKDKEKGVFYLSDSVLVKDLANNIFISVGQLRKDAFLKYKENKKAKTDAYFKFFEEKKKLKPSAVYAEAFYRADFIDLTLEEKLAMDKDLERRYPHLKKLSVNHKQKLEKNRRRADRTAGALLMIDVGLTLWFVGDIYKGIKWSVKSIKALRNLFVAGKAVKGLSNAKRIAFLKTFAKNNPHAVKLNRKLNRIKTMPQRVSTSFPKYKAQVKAKFDNFNEFMIKTRDYMGVPNAMPGQRFAVAAYNNSISTSRGFYASKYAKAASKAKVAGPLNIVDKHGQPISYNELKFNEEGILEIDGDFFKTYKATMKTEDIIAYNALIDKTIADLEKTLKLNKERISFLAREYNKADALSSAELLEYEKFKNMAETLDTLKERRFVTFRFNDVKRLSVGEKWRSHEKGHALLPIYNEEGQLLSQVALDKALKSAQNLITEVKNGKKIILKGDKIYLDGTLLNVGIGAPKATITLLGKAGVKVEDLSFLSLRKKKSKMFSLIFNNALTFSAASTSLNLSLAKAPFSITKEEGNPNYVTQGLNMALSVALPYALSFLSPMAAPFVKRFGASRMQTASLAIAGTGMTIAWFNGYKGFATKKYDENGNLVYDENGKTITADKSPAIWPLVIAAITSGVSSSLTRASLNIAIERYQVSKATMVTSMIAKNAGSLFMTIIPASADALLQRHKDNYDFSISYPVLAVLSGFGAGLMIRNIPSNVAREVDYSITAREILKPFGMVNPISKTKTIIPYYLSFMSFGATESYALFKTFNSFSRDGVEAKTAGTGWTGNDNKLLASFIATLPSALVRGLKHRKVDFSKGIANNIALTTLGIVLLMAPSENLSKNQNLALGLASGSLIGAGTANMYQYLQKLMLKDVVSDMTLVRKYKGISALKTTAQSAYAGANIGLAIPIVYSKFFAERYKKDEVGGQYSIDFKANQKVLPIALGVYGLGILPLLRTPFRTDMVKNISSLNSRLSGGKLALISAPLGIWAMNDLHNFSIFSAPVQNKVYPTGRKINLDLPPTFNLDFTPPVRLPKFFDLPNEAEKGLPEEQTQKESETAPFEE